MFFNKIFHFLKGYVIIDVSGFYIERFLYLCAKEGICFFSMGKRKKDTIKVCANISDFKKIRPVVCKTGVKIHIIKKCGLPFILKKMKKRCAFIAGLAVIFVLSIILSNFIWSVEIVSDNEETAKEVAYAVEKAGVKIGAFKPGLPEGEQIKSIILNNTKNVVWAWVHIKGTKAVVDFKEGLVPPVLINRKIPCDIVASRDGIIEKIIEKNGNKRVSVGDTVQKGDLLIAGTKDLVTGGYKTVHAIGDVYARVWHEKSEEYKLYTKEKVKKGNKKTYITIKLFSKCFDLYKEEKVDFDDYIIDEKMYELKIGKDNFLGFGIYKKEYIQSEEVLRRIDMEDALKIAQYDLEKRISKELNAGSILKEKKLTHSKIDDETIKVTLTMEFIEKIGEEKKIN